MVFIYYYYVCVYVCTHIKQLRLPESGGIPTSKDEMRTMIPVHV